MCLPSPLTSVHHFQTGRTDKLQNFRSALRPRSGTWVRSGPTLSFVPCRRGTPSARGDAVLTGFCQPQRFTPRHMREAGETGSRQLHTAQGLVGARRPRMCVATRIADAVVVGPSTRRCHRRFRTSGHFSRVPRRLRAKTGGGSGSSLCSRRGGRRSAHCRTLEKENNDAPVTCRPE